MPKFTIKSEKIAGFAMEQAYPDQKFKMAIKDSITSDEQFFYNYITNINNVFLNKTGFPVDFVSKFLIVLHDNNIADIYINDIREIIKAKVNKDIKKGELVYKENITDILELKHLDIEIQPTDAIVYCRKATNWKFGVYFDFTRRMNIDNLSKDLGKLVRDQEFKSLIDTTASAFNKVKERTLDAFIFTEGETDWMHLRRAGEELRVNLNLKFDESQKNRGDKDTLLMCEHFSRKPNEQRIIFVFDRDNPEIIKKLADRTVGSQNYQSWGNNVFSFIIPAPSHRQEYKNISIEFYYKDQEIRTKDVSNRRLFFDNEIKKEVIADRLINITETSPDESLEFEKKIYDKDVEKIIDGEKNQIALSKTCFAKNILNKEKGFGKFDFSEFIKIFKIIEDIIKNNS